jgi:hypothetical protein
MTCTGTSVEVSRYYLYVTYGGLTMRQRSDIVLHVHPPLSFGLRAAAVRR